METIFSKDSHSGKSYIAFFDLDRTIISINSGKTLIRYAYKIGLMTRIDLIKGVYYSILYRLNLKDTARIINSMVKWVKGVPENKMIELSEEIFKNHILKSIRIQVESEINLHKRNGARVVILSSSIRPVCQVVAKHLQIDDIICSNLEVLNGVYTGCLTGQLCYGEEKVDRLSEYCSKNSTKTSDAWYYGDSISDLPALISVGYPVCVNPDKTLKKAALKRGWKILQ